jgi:hypothetical protein
LANPNRGWSPWGDHSLLYFAYTCVQDLFIRGVIHLAKKIIRWWYFTCKKLENIICDGVLHVNMFHYFKIPHFICKCFTKFTYNEYIGPFFLSHVVLRFLPSDLPGMKPLSSYFLDLEWISYPLSKVYIARAHYICTSHLQYICTCNLDLT